MGPSKPARDKGANKKAQNASPCIGSSSSGGGRCGIGSSSSSSSRSSIDKVKKLAEDLSSPDDNQRLQATVFLANLFMNSNSNPKIASSFLAEPVLQVLSLRLIDQNAEIKTCAAGAIRNIAGHGDPHISSLLIESGIFDSIIAMISINLQSCSQIAIDEVAYVEQLVKAVTNIYASTSQTIATDGALTSLLVETLISAPPDHLTLVQASANLLFVITDENPAACRQIIDSELYKNFISKITDISVRSSFNSSLLELFEIGILTNIWFDQQDLEENPNVEIIIRILFDSLSSSLKTGRPLQISYFSTDGEQFTSCLKLSCEILTNLFSMWYKNGEEVSSEHFSELANEAFSISIECLRDLTTIQINESELYSTQETDELSLCADCLLTLIGNVLGTEVVDLSKHKLNLFFEGIYPFNISKTATVQACGSIASDDVKISSFHVMNSILKSILEMASNRLLIQVLWSQLQSLQTYILTAIRGKRADFVKPSLEILSSIAECMNVYLINGSLDTSTKQQLVGFVQVLLTITEKTFS